MMSLTKDVEQLYTRAIKHVESVPISRVVSRTPQTLDFLKVNCDGAFCAGNNAATIGIVCRDFVGQFIWVFVDKVKSILAFID